MRNASKLLLPLLLLLSLGYEATSRAAVPNYLGGFNLGLVDAGGIVDYQEGGGSFSGRVLYHPCYDFDQNFGLCGAFGAGPLKGENHIFLAVSGELRAALHIPDRPAVELGGGIQQWTDISKFIGTVSGTVLFPFSFEDIPGLDGLFLTGSLVFVPSNIIVEGVVGARFDISGLFD